MTPEEQHAETVDTPTQDDLRTESLVIIPARALSPEEQRARNDEYASQSWAFRQVVFCIAGAVAFLVAVLSPTPDIIPQPSRLLYWLACGFAVYFAAAGFVWLLGRWRNR